MDEDCLWSEQTGSVGIVVNSNWVDSSFFSIGSPFFFVKSQDLLVSLLVDFAFLAATTVLKAFA
jgi:hypothetical protein